MPPSLTAPAPRARTATPTQTSTATNLLRTVGDATSVLVLRGGQGTTSVADNIAQALFLDEVAADGSQTLWNSIAVRITTSATAGSRCVLSSMSATAPDEGLLTTTVDGTAATWLCNDAAAGSSPPNAGTYRVVGVVFANGTVDTRTRITKCVPCPAKADDDRPSSVSRRSCPHLTSI